MHIILDHSFSSTMDTSPSCRSLSNLIIEMANRHQEDSFTVLSNSAGKRGEHFPSNMKLHQIKTGGWKLAAWRWWRSFMLPRVLKKLGCDLFLTTDADMLPACPCKVCLFQVKDLSTQQLAGNVTAAKNLFIKKVRQVDGVITWSTLKKEFLQSLSPAGAGKIHSLRPGPIEEIQPLKWTEKEGIKVQHAGGREYFVYTGELDDSDNLFLLLRAFSRFKKRQLSNMQLVLAGNTTTSTTRFLEKLSSFKYRADVHVLENPNKDVLLQVIAASYAFLGEGLADELQVNIQRAIHAGVPVIQAADEPKSGSRGYGIMYTPQGTEQALSDGMQLIYKDENLRTELIQSARRHIDSGEKYDVVEACRKLLKEILQTNHSNFTTI